jgi:5-methylcytosine-specific restriction protein A
MAVRKIKDYVVGDSYTRNEFMESFKVSGQSGMMRSKVTNTLVLISNHTKELYSDDWHGGVMHYTGMGRTGDQDLYFAQNRTLLESNTNGITVHFFEIYNNSIQRKYIYSGIVKLVGKPFKAIQPDINDEDRIVWIFPIRALQTKDQDVFEIDETTSTIIHQVMEEEGIEQGEIILVETERPHGSNKPKYKKQTYNGKKTDFIQKSKRDTAIGLRGEELVVLYEKNYLTELGLIDLANQVK